MLELYVTGQSLKLYTPVIAADSLNYLTAEVHFTDSTWDGYSPWLHFKRGETVYDIALRDGRRIDAEQGLDLTAGEWELYLTGTKGDSRLTTVTAMLTVRESGLTDAPLHRIPQSVAEQVDDKASTALAIAQSVKDAADRGLFNGKGFTIKGFYNSLTALESENPIGDTGEVYAVGTSPDFVLYIWDAISDAWMDCGRISAIRGERGEPGAVYTPQLEENGNLSWTNSAGLPNPPMVNIRGAQGVQGARGENGKGPYQLAAEHGYTGTEQTFNTAISTFPYHNARHLPGGADPISVKTGNITDLAVTNTKLAADAVTTAKVSNGNITRAKLASDALYSPVLTIADARAITAADLGKTIKVYKSGADVNFTISKTEFDSWPMGFEVAIYWHKAKSVSITTSGNLYVCSALTATAIQNAVIRLNNTYSMAAIKKIAIDAILVTGDCEVTAS